MSQVPPWWLRCWATAPLTLMLAATATGCALFSKGAVTEPRYFTPESSFRKQSLPQERPPSDLRLRLGRVTSGAHLGERIVFRPSEQEVAFYDDRRWTERPVNALRRALTRVLFEEEGLGSVISGAAPTLDVELVRFEEVMAPPHRVRVLVALSVHDSRVVRLQEALDVERPITSTKGKAAAVAAAEAFGEALDAAVREVAARVTAELSTHNRERATVPAQGPR